MPQTIILVFKNRENVRKSILRCTRKYYSQRSTVSTNEPEMAFSKFDIQRLLSGYREPTTTGFGTVDLFNNPQLRKKNKKLKAKDILEEIVEVKIGSHPEIGIFINLISIGIQVKERIIKKPIKFTFKGKI